MNNFMRFFNKNQKNIFLATAVVIFVILIIVILNQYYIAQEENNQKIAQDKQLTTENGYSSVVPPYLLSHNLFPDELTLIAQKSRDGYIVFFQASWDLSPLLSEKEVPAIKRLLLLGLKAAIGWNSSSVPPYLLSQILFPTESIKTHQ